MKGVPSNVVAACFALAAFTVAVLSGLAAGNAPAETLFRAVVSMILCYPLGFAAGLTCQRVIDLHAARLKAEADNGATSAPPENAVPEEDEEVIVV